MDNYYAIVSPPAVVAADGAAVATVCLSGELDLGAGDDLRAAVLGAITTQPTTSVVVDLADVTFIDAVTVGILLDAHFLARQRSVTFRVTGAHGVVQRVLDVLDATGLLQPNRPSP